MSNEQIFTNARLVLPDEIVTGHLVIRDGVIADFDTGAISGGEDMEGDYILPGLIELHTDHLESHYMPRPGVRWNALSALQSHDAQVAASGITTVFDCLRIGTDYDASMEPGETRALADTITAAQDEGRLRSEHRIHLRCEVSSPDAMTEFNTFFDHEDVRLVSLMDHAPGQRQFQRMDQYILYYQTKRGMSDETFARFVKERIDQSQTYSDMHRLKIAAECRRRNITLASHDDATKDHVDIAVRDGVRLAEFPTTIEAAVSSDAKGMSVLMGAPNVVRGKSHSGNISARDLAEKKLLHVLSSDYIPMSLMHAPFVLADEQDGISLPEAIAMVSDNPAKTVGLDDRGRIEAGRRADLVRVRREEGVPIIRSVWRGGNRVI